MYKSLKTQLTVLQQEGYSITRFLMWWFGHPFSYFISSKKPLVVTKKVKKLLGISYLIFGLLIIFSILTELFFFIPVSIVLFLFQPFIFLFIAIFIVSPLEKINRSRTVSHFRKVILGLPDLTVIGITGSYGKTSVKDFLFTILNGWQETVKTPESYNTVFGIAKVIDFELLPRTKYFVCEMGAYIRGEIVELCRMVPPKYAILTAIGTQHLQRFKSVKNTTLAKFELIDSVKPSHALVNLDNSFIADRLKDPRYQGVKTYSIFNPRADFFVKKYSLSSQGLSFTMVYLDKSYSYASPLFGTSNLYNLTAAIAMAKMLKVPEAIISKQVSKIASSPHRLQLKKIHKAILIDNAFSSNEEGFTNLIGDLSRLPGKKVLITPGIIELGIQTVEVHQKLGQLLSPVFEKVILVGKSLRTLSLEQGLNQFQVIHNIPSGDYEKQYTKKLMKAGEGTTVPETGRERIDSNQFWNTTKNKRQSKIQFISNSTDLWPLIEDLSKDYAWILLENDLPDTF